MASKIGVVPLSRWFPRVSLLTCTVTACALTVGGLAEAVAPAPPVVSSLSATSGAVGGHAKLTIHGSGFTGVSDVLFGGAKGGSVHVVSATVLTVVVPAHKAARLAVRVVTGDGTSHLSSHDVFTYVAAPAVTSVSVVSGVVSGGVKLTVKGSGFTHVKKVLFGKAVGTKLHVVSSKTLTVYAPAHTLGRVDVRVISSYGTSPAKVADRFTFTAPPVVVPSPVVTTTALPAAERGQPYASALTGSGTGTLTFAAAGLPAGLSLTSAGALSGTTFAPAGTYPVTVTVVDAGGRSGTAQLALAVKVHAGQVLAWGDNNRGGLGNGTTSATSATTPAVVAGLTDVVQVVAGFYASYAVRADGTVYSWGSNMHDSLGDGTTTDHTTPQQVPGLSGIVAMAASTQSAFALKSDGTVLSWGDDTEGELGNGSTQSQTAPVPVLGPTDVVQLAAGSTDGYALQADGQVWSWGDNGDGQLGSGVSDMQDSTPALIPGLTNVRAITAKESNAFALLSDGTVRGWGYNFDGEVGDTTKTQRSTPVAVYGLTGVTAIADASLSAYALTSDGTVHAWGYNPEGELGDGSTTTRLSPVAVAGATGVQSIAASDYNAFATRSDGSVLVWGMGGDGDNGDGTSNDQHAPEVNASLAGVTGVGSAFATELAIR